MKPNLVLSEGGKPVAFELAPKTPARVFPFNVWDRGKSELMLVAPIDLINLGLTTPALYEWAVCWGAAIASMNGVWFGFCEKPYALCFFGCTSWVSPDGEEEPSINAKGAKDLLSLLQTAAEEFDKIMSPFVRELYIAKTILSPD